MLSLSFMEIYYYYFFFVQKLCFVEVDESHVGFSQNLLCNFEPSAKLPKYTYGSKKISKNSAV